MLSLEEYLKLPYTIITHEIDENEGGGWVAMFPQFGSWMLGDGDTPEEATQNLKIIQKKLFEAILNVGEIIPLPSN